MSTNSGKENGYNRSVIAELNYISAPPARGFGIGEAVYRFAQGART
jgi:hypothetical protein